MSSDKPQFEQGHQPPVSFQEKPGLQKDMPNPKPLTKYLPTEDGGSQLYKAAGKLQGKRAVITGGDSGIGRAIATLFAMEGAHCLIAYLPEEEADAQETKKEVESNGVKCYLYQTDLRDRKNCKATIDQAVSSLGGIDILVNNHAVQQTIDAIEDLTEEQWLNTFDTNIHPFFLLSKYALPHMKRGSTIINNASINAYVGRPDLLDYTSTKGAIVSFTRGLSNMILGSRAIRVNAVAPGPVWTPLVPATMGRPQQEGFTAPMGRPSQPSEIATCFVFLASLDSASISGQTIHANGGVVVNG